jgi:hypothetical protein
MARQHINQARNMATIIRGATVENRRITQLESGRIVYQYDTQYKYHYFPIQTGPVQVKQMDNGPLWAANDLAVSDADIVYLTLDLTSGKVDEYLYNAEKSIADGNLKDADSQLAQLTETVVVVESITSVPSDKAHDNIALARAFINGKNYDGASYALKHADDALDEMQRSDTYKTRRTEIISMRKDVSALQAHIAKKDPTMIQKAATKLDTWWKDLKDWSNGNS